MKEVRTSGGWGWLEKGERGEWRKEGAEEGGIMRTEKGRGEKSNANLFYNIDFGSPRSPPSRKALPFSPWKSTPHFLPWAHSRLSPTYQTPSILFLLKLSIFTSSVLRSNNPSPSPLLTMLFLLQSPNILSYFFHFRTSSGYLSAQGDDLMGRFHGMK